MSAVRSLVVSVSQLSDLSSPGAMVLDAPQSQGPAAPDRHIVQLKAMCDSPDMHLRGGRACRRGAPGTRAMHA
jgi:hypothetical protein